MNTVENKEITIDELTSALLKLKNDTALITYLRDETGERIFGKPNLDTRCDDVRQKFPEQCLLYDEVIREGIFDLVHDYYKDVEIKGKKQTVPYLNFEVVDTLIKLGITVMMVSGENTTSNEDVVMFIYFDLGDIIV